MTSLAALHSNKPLRTSYPFVVSCCKQVKHLTYSEEIIFDNLVKLRNELKATLEARAHATGSSSSLKMSYMPIILKATSLALSAFPSLNATVNADVTEMTYHSNHNVSDIYITTI